MRTGRRSTIQITKPMTVPDGWVRHQKFEGTLPISRQKWVRYYIPENHGRGIWITELSDRSYRLHLYTERRRYSTLEQAVEAAHCWMRDKDMGCSGDTDSQ